MVQLEVWQPGVLVGAKAPWALHGRSLLTTPPEEAEADGAMRGCGSGAVEGTFTADSVGTAVECVGVNESFGDSGNGS